MKLPLFCNVDTAYKNGQEGVKKLSKIFNLLLYCTCNWYGRTGLPDLSDTVSGTSIYTH